MQVKNEDWKEIKQVANQWKRWFDSGEAIASLPSVLASSPATSNNPLLFTGLASADE